MNLTGTFEGYVPVATDLYLRGNNIANLSIRWNARLDSGQISLSCIASNNSFGVETTTPINLTGFNYLNIEKNIPYNYSRCNLYLLAESSSTRFIDNISGSGVISFDISTANLVTGFRVQGSADGAIYRIWLS